MKLFLLPLGLLQPLGIPIPGYLIQTDEDKNILVDTGFPHAFIDHPPGPMGPLALQVEMHPEDFIVSRLTSLGLRPVDVQTVVATHFDLDHAGSLSLFPQAKIVVQRAQYEAALAGHERSARSQAEWDTPDLHFQVVHGDAILVPGVELLESGGHVPGHQSVLVRLPDTGPVLLAIDAIPLASMTNADTRVIMSNDEDEAATRASTRKLMQVAFREAVTLIVHGHDPAQWPTLRHAPLFYS